jgi:LPPG:FO 2-phospho-L-lactate transferase
MSNDRVRTRVCTREGELDFQVYFVRRGARDPVLGVRFEGVEHARPSPGVIAAIESASKVIVCPSNPFISVGPILGVPGIRDALRSTRARLAAISPIVGGRAIKGPAARMMKSMNLRPAAVEVARLYQDFLDVFVLDEIDRKQASEVEALGIEPVVTNTIMSGVRERKALARRVLEAL